MLRAPMDETKPPRRREKSLPEARAEATRNQILDVAERLFAENGFAGTSMRALAEGASTSQALLHHHFGTKAALYEAVKRRYTERFRAMQEAELGEGAVDLDVVASTILGYFRFLREHPELARLASWAKLEGDGAPLGGEEEIWRKLESWTSEAQSRGFLRTEVDRKLFLVMGAATVQYWFDNRAFVCQVLGLDPDDPTLDERYLGQAIDVLLFGAAKRGATLGARDDAPGAGPAPRKKRRSP